MTALFATSYDGLGEFLVGGALLTAACLLLSFWPAAYGHWSTLVLAVPGLLVGILLLLLFSGPHSDVEVRIFAASPAALAIGSLALWARQRKRKRHNLASDENA